jgi:xylan 1,4-beta-xylosidase
MKFIHQILFLFLIFNGNVFAQKINPGAASTYKNPVIAGDFADPSVIRVGDTYYAVGTSSEWGPAYPIYTSKDLVNWEYAGPVFSDLPAWTMGSYWAPELFYRNGTFFVYYTARRKSDKQSFIGVASTKDLKKGFTDHGLLLEWTKEAIDAFVVEDAGKLFLTWKAYGLDQGRGIELLGAELSDDGLKVTGKEFSLLKADKQGWEAGGMEGQAIFKKGNYWYMLYSGNACCGEKCNYQVGLARAEKLQGPWTKYSGNPVLSGDETWKCPGHGTVVTTADNRYFYLHHAYKGTDFTSTGRQGVLSELVWDKTSEWPSFRYGKATPAQAEAPMGAKISDKEDLYIKFDKDTSKAPWVYDVSVPKPHYATQNGSLQLENSTLTKTGNFLGLVVKGGNYVFSIEATPKDDITQNIVVYGDAENAIGYGVTKNKIKLWQVKDGVYRTINSQEIPGTVTLVDLQLKSQLGRIYEFSWSTKDKNSNSLSQPFKIEGAWLPRWDRAPRVGINVSGSKPGKGDFRSVQMKYE